MGKILTTTVQDSTRRLSGRMRVTLDVIRALAASYVVIHHVVVNSGLSGPVTYPFRFGQEAVIVFFLLSGFLIFASERSRVLGNLRGYYLRRLRRIYPLLLLAMGITAAVAWLDGALAEGFRAIDFGLNLLSLQDVSALKPGVIVDPFLGNSPLWSLSYEVFFYLVFPLVMIAWRVSRQRAIMVVGAVSLIGYGTFLCAPNHFSLVAAYLLTWWAGAVVADLYQTNRLSIRGLLPITVWMVGLCAVAGIGAIVFGRSGAGVFPVLPLRHFAFALLCILLCGTSLAAVLIKTAQPFARPAAYIASISYGLYVFHYPLLVQWEGAHTPIGFALALILLVITAILGDRLLERVMPRPARITAQA